MECGTTDGTQRHDISNISISYPYPGAAAKNEALLDDDRGDLVGLDKAAWRLTGRLFFGAELWYYGHRERVI
jgi:hypothetical protein